jgi:hypothetical protein
VRPSTRAAARRDEPAETIPCLGSGIFWRMPRGAAGGEEPGLVRVRVAVAEAHGPGWLAARLAGAGRAARTAAPLPGSASPASGAISIARRYADRSARLWALEVLQAARPLRPDAVRDTGLALAADDRAGLHGLAVALERRAHALLASRRSDAGSVLAVTLARLAVVDRSLRSGRWMVLDTFPDDAARLAPVHAQRHAAALAAAIDANREDLEAARRRLLARVGSARPAERVLAAFEAAANRWLEARNASNAAAPYRLAGGTFVPARAMRQAPRRGDCDAVLVRAAEDARSLATVHRERLRAERGYDLLRRNCVTELLATLAEAGVGAPRGGRLDFIPVVADARLARRLPVRGATTLPSRRDAVLADLREHAHPLVVALRESNTLTAAAYDRNPDDSLFLFFTDGAAVLRPLFGAVNLGVGVGAAAAGLATWPLDAGYLLAAGARGALFSLPELAFVNVRKGTYNHVPRGLFVGSTATPIAGS